MNRKTWVYICKKFAQLVLTLLVLSLVVFLVSRLAPGDPLRSFYGDAVERMSTEQQEAARERLGLNEGLLQQYINWISGAVQGDFGISFKYKQDVLDVIGQVWGNTFILTFICLVLILLLGMALAVFCVSHEGELIDRAICKIGVAVSSIPEFFAALVLVLIFSVNLGILPSGGVYSIGGGSLSDRVVHLILPVSAIVITHLWYCAYLMRNKLSEEVRKEYVLLYRVKGVSRRRILWVHCMKNSMPAIVSMMAIFLPHLLGGAYIIEMVFSYPGLGRLGFESAKYHDYNLLMVISLLTGAAVILANMAAQIINEKLDARMEYDRTEHAEENRNSCPGGGSFE